MGDAVSYFSNYVYNYRDTWDSVSVSPVKRAKKGPTPSSGAKYFNLAK